jgi:hypothetical protein
MLHEPRNIHRCRDNADAVANDLASNEKGIHGRHPQILRLLVGVELGSPFAWTDREPRLRTDGNQKPGATVKTSGRTRNRQPTSIF